MGYVARDAAINVNIYIFDSLAAVDGLPPWRGGSIADGPVKCALPACIVGLVRDEVAHVIVHVVEVRSRFGRFGAVTLDAAHG